VRREGPLRVMFAGSFQERKHPELVLDAAVQWPGVEFVVIGDGPLKPLLMTRVREEKLSNVFLLSTKEYSEYAKLLATADIFFFPSRVEGLGKVLLEAASCGIPILVFDDYETPIVVDDVTGFKVKTFEEMLKRLKELIEDKELRLKMGSAAAEHVKRFDWNHIARQWERVFAQTVACSR
jgi:glycosyltransferase involved in cell wall biosynthesis